MADTDPLLWFQTVSRGDVVTHTVLIGYHEATLMAEGGDGSVIGQEVQVTMGASAAQNTFIYANTLYLQPGGLYEFPGKNITIVARRLGMSSSLTKNATISVDGRNGGDASPPTAPKVGQTSAPDQAGENQKGTNGARGLDGDPGAAGKPGTDAGNIALLIFEQIKRDSSNTFPLILSAKGGAGSNGQPGQDGQDGQNGGEGGPEYNYNPAGH